MADRYAYDVWLSHNSKDEPRVRALEDLRASDLRGAIERIETARAQVLRLPTTALRSEMALERGTVLLLDPAGGFSIVGLPGTGARG